MLYKDELYSTSDQYFEVINEYGKCIKNYILVIKNVNKFVNLIYTNQLHNENAIFKFMNVDGNNFTINIIFSELVDSFNILWMPFTKINKINKHRQHIKEFIINSIYLNEYENIRTTPYDILSFNEIEIITNITSLKHNNKLEIIQKFMKTLLW